MSSVTSILLVDDHAIARRGCRQLLEQANFKAIREATSGEEALYSYLEEKPQIIVMDLSMAGMGGLEAIRRILSRTPSTRIVVFTMHDDPTFAARALRAGVLGYVTKTSPPECLVEAVRRALNGKIYLSQDIAQALALCNLKPGAHPLTSLSNREFDVFQMLVEGKTCAQIAATLSLSQKSVSNYSLRIKQKLGAQSVADLVRIAITHGVPKH
ncbi:MAG: response regulator, partial [Nitrososphaerales archaeon]